MLVIRGQHRLFAARSAFSSYTVSLQNDAGAPVRGQRVLRFGACCVWFAPAFGGETRAMGVETHAAEVTPLLRKQRDTNGRFAPSVTGFFGTTRDATADHVSGPSRWVRALIAVGAVAMLCVGAAAIGSNVRGSLGTVASRGEGFALGVDETVDLGEDAENAEYSPYKDPKNVVHYPNPLPPVDFTGKTLLIVMGHPYSGTSGLEGLIGTGSGVTDLCASETWQCEDTWLLKYMDMPIEPGEDEFEPTYPVDADGYAYAFTHFALTWWDMSKPLLMDKTPNLLAHYKTIKRAADKLDVPVKFVLLTRHPFSWTSDKHPFDETQWLKLMEYNKQVLGDDTIDLHHVRYEDLAWAIDETVEALEAFLPKLGKLDPWASALAFEEEKNKGPLQGSRADPIAKYFLEHPLEWEPNWTLSDNVFKTLCAVGYAEHGECDVYIKAG